jgi:hypothetical protein
MTDEAERLISLMSDLSEELWCAGWLIDCEYLFWKWATAKGVHITAIAAIKEAGSEAGGWAHWPTDDRDFPIGDGPVFVPITEWLYLYNAWLKNEQRRYGLIASEMEKMT